MSEQDLERKLDSIVDLAHELWHESRFSRAEALARQLSEAAQQVAEAFEARQKGGRVDVR